MENPTRRTVCLFLASATLLWATIAPRLAQSSSHAQRPLRILVPRMGSLPGLEAELARFFKEFGTAHPDWPLQILRRGEGWSALRELMAAYLASDLPDLALIEEPELAALNAHELLRPVQGQGRWKAFATTVPVLLTNVSARPEQPPTTFTALIEKGKAVLAPGRTAILLPLEGPRGLWLFESLMPGPLWERSPGGLRAGRSSEELIRGLQTATDTPGLLRREETWEHAFGEWIQGKGVYLATGLETLALLKTRASFAWSASLLPGLNAKAAPLATGNGWVALSDHPGIGPLLNALYTPREQAQWLVEGGLLPPSGKAFEEWKTAAAPQPAYRDLAMRAMSLHPRARAADPQMVRARSQWTQSLKRLMAQPSERIPLEVEFVQLDTHLTRP